MTAANIEAVHDSFIRLQATIVGALEHLDGEATFIGDTIETPGGGMSQPRVLQHGRHIEKAAVQFSHSVGAALPPAASDRNPRLAGRPFEAVAISLIVHPRNPHVPTTHMNLRFFAVDVDPPHWHFGGGFDLTPYYLYADDAVHWHDVSARAVGAAHYPAMKAACDEYFFLAHRAEARGIGGLFFDDFGFPDFASSFDLVERVGVAFLEAYRPIVEKRMHTPYGDAEEQWMLIRRGRYAEFNLAIDRGTRYGLQSGRRIESVLASMPPRAEWHYDHRPLPGTAEADLVAALETPREWLAPADSVDR